LAITYHNTARQELIQRIGHRDAALALFLTASAALFGFAVGSGGIKGSSFSRPVLLFAVPVLGLGAAIITSQHNNVIGALGHYLGNELHDAIDRLIPDDDLPVQWDSSSTLLAMGTNAKMRVLAAVLLILVPQCLAIVLADGSIRAVRSETIVGTVIGILCVFATALMIFNSF
jgi:hypothetical protein